MPSNVVYGPLQLFVVGFGQAALPLDFVNQLRRVRDDGIVRLVDAVYAAKDEHGNLSQIRVTDFSKEEMALFGTLAGALFGYGAAGEEGAVLGAVLGEMAAESREIGLDRDDMDEIADRIPRGTSVGLHPPGASLGDRTQTVIAQHARRRDRQRLAHAGHADCARRRSGRGC